MAIAIIIPVFRQAHYLERCLQSLVGQIGSADRVIVVDDNPAGDRDSERISEVVREFSKNHPTQRADIIRNGKNAGVAAARNAGVEALKGECEWLKFLDADDLLAPFALETFRRQQLPATMHVVSGSLTQVIDGVAGRTLTPDFGRILHVNPSVVSCSFIRSAIWATIGGFDPRLQFEEDWDLWLRIEKHFGIGTFGILQTVICYYWISETERAQKIRDLTVEVVDTLEGAKRIGVRDYLRLKYNTKV